MTDSQWRPDTSPPWQSLEKLAASDGQISMQRLFEADPERANNYALQLPGLYLDYSKNRVSDEVLSALLDLAKSSPLKQKIDAMFAGEKINRSEDRAVLHTALRARPQDNPLSGQVHTALDHMYSFTEQLHAGKFLGSTGDRFTDIVNIGIGGSDLGPRMVCKALEEYRLQSLNVHFIANVDGADINILLNQLNPATTMVIVSSKTFTTQETLMNAQRAFQWLSDNLSLDNACESNHVLAVTANPQRAMGMGIDSERIFEFWDWVGGRYSLWSSIGLSVALSIGKEHFEKLLAGAAAMDEHFRSAPFEANMPVILGLLGIWYHNFLGASSLAVIPYCERLGLLPAYLQQLDMESNGKGVTVDGSTVNYTTGPVVWGQTGTNAQHAFFQLLHQGTHLVPMDMIGAVNDPLSNPKQHRVLLANMLAQSAALLSGDGDPETDPQRYYPGNRPTNTLLLDELSPKNLGALLALYEHKVLVQGVIWNVNSFDQWGVELGKRLANRLLDDKLPDKTLDASTRALRRRIL